jgi:copper chaperone
MLPNCYRFLTDSFTGIKTYTVSLDSQTADVTTEDAVSYEQVLEKIKKTGKTVNSGEADGVVMSV